jgi:hypothetical protein
MIEPEVVRELALSLEGSEERDHCGIPSFRYRVIYATLWIEERYVHLMLTPEMQHELVRDAPEIFSQVPNKWGLNGATRVNLNTVTREEMMAVLKLAWELAKPKPKISKRSAAKSD